MSQEEITFSVAVFGLIVAVASFAIWRYKRHKEYMRYRAMVREHFDAAEAAQRAQRGSLVEDIGEFREPLWVDPGPRLRRSTASPPVWHTDSTVCEKTYESSPSDNKDFKLHKLECDNCGSPLTVTEGKRLAFCAFCNAQYYLEGFEPELEDFRHPSETSMSSLYCREDPFRYSGGASNRRIYAAWFDE